MRKSCPFRPGLPDALNRQINNSVRRLFLKRALAVEESTVTRFQGQLRQTGASIWCSEFPQLLGPALFNKIEQAARQPENKWLKTIPNVLAFGAELGRIALSCADREGVCEKVLSGSATWNLVVTLTDKIIDDFEGGERFVDQLLHPGMEHLTGVTSFRHMKTVDLPMPQRFLLRTMETYMARIRSTAAAENGAIAYRRFIAASDRMIKAERELRKIPLGPEADLSAVESLLGDKCAMPVLSCFYAGLMFSGDLDLRPDRVENIGQTIGRVMLLLDDLCDIVEDTHAGRWNICHVRLFEAEPGKCPQCGFSCCMNFIFDVLVHGLVLHETVAELADACESIPEMSWEYDDFDISLRQWMVAWVYSWLGLFDTPQVRAVQ